MYCSQCGTKNSPENKFCQGCGKEIQNNMPSSQPAAQPVEQPIVQQQPEMQPTPVEQPVIQSQSEWQQAPTPQPQVNYNQQPQTGELSNDELLAKNAYFGDSPQMQQQFQQMRNNQMNQPQSSGKGLAITSLVLGIISMVTGLIFFISLPAAIVGLVLGIMSKAKGGLKISGIITSAIGLVIASFITLLIFITPTTEVFEGNGYKLTYDVEWDEVTLKGGQQALAYDEDDGYLVPIGKSALGDTTANYERDKDSIYRNFKNLWSKEGKENNLYIYSGSETFLTLTESIDYATYTYGTSQTNIKGKYILLISEEQNAILSFMTNGSDDIDELNEAALELLKTIEIDKQVSKNPVSENTVYDDDLSSALNQLSNWNRYKSLRQGTLGNKKDITGGWRILSDATDYWTFKNGEFYWYQNASVLTDNYWQGTYTITSGRAGLLAAGLDSSKIDKIISDSKGQITENDIVTITGIPKKLIINGVDKSSENITAESKITLIWIMVGHGTEGIEGQVLNLNNYSTSYYVKLTD